MEEFVTCQLCGVERRELNGHLRMHGVSVAQYKEMFPNAAIISTASSRRKSNAVSEAFKDGRPAASKTTRTKLSLAGKERHRRERAENPENWLAKQQASAELARQAKGADYRHSADTLAKMRGPRPHMRGRSHKEETKQKLSKARRGRKFQPHSPETIVKMKQAWDRRKADKETYAAYLQGLSERMSSPEAIKRMRDRTAALIQQGNHNGKSKDTGIELIFKQYLDGVGLAYEHQFVVDTRKGAFTFDFFITGLHLLVEVDGEYWHTKSLEVWSRDKLKQRLASELGFTVARISDKEWYPEIIHESQDTIKASSNAILERRHQRITARKGA